LHTVTLGYCLWGRVQTKWHNFFFEFPNSVTNVSIKKKWLNLMLRNLAYSLSKVESTTSKNFEKTNFLTIVTIYSNAMNKKWYICNALTFWKMIHLPITASTDTLILPGANLWIFSEFGHHLGKFEASCYKRWYKSNTSSLKIGLLCNKISMCYLAVTINLILKFVSLKMINSMYMTFK